MFKYIFLLIGLLFLTAPANADTVPPQDLADEGGQFIEIDGHSIYYIMAGSADAPTIILLHGFGGSTFTWRDNMPALLDAGYRVLAYDRPPFGLSEKSRDVPLSADAQAGQLRGLMDALDIPAATLVGHSAGAGVMSYFAVEHPARVDALVFVAGAVAIGDDAPQVEADDDELANAGAGGGGLFDLIGNIDFDNPQASRLVSMFLTPERFFNILASAYHPSFDVTDDIVDGYTRVLSVDNWEEGLIAIFAERQTPQALDARALITVAESVPVAIIWGAEDSWIPLSAGEALLSRIPSAQFIAYEGVGHMPMEENVTDFNRDLLDFLSATYGG
ncbi:MAG: alpha/beta hydrolase [Anaerolineaceae bacterium]|nr:MAG: alpha/beta hydrolase [Anaerolineaceae bacterium]